MEVPLELSFRHVENKDEIEQVIREKAAKLDRLCDHIISCRIAVDQLHHQHRNGNPYRVRIIVRIPPGHEVIVAKEPAKDDNFTLLTLVHDAFDITERRIKEVVRKQQGQVKRHTVDAVGAVVDSLNKDEGYGFLRTIDNQEIYFHRNSVLHHDFDRLELGTGVRYVSEVGDKGLQASTVQIVDKPGL